MGNLLELHNLVFLIPMAFGILLVFGSLFGLGHEADHDVEHDMDHDVGHHDHGHDHGHAKDGKTQNPLAAAPTGEGNEHPLYLQFFAMLGLGRVPLTVLLMILSLTFGCIGLVFNLVLGPMLKTPWLYGWISFGAAVVGSFFLSGKIARLVNRFMPSTETHVVSKHDLIGRTGTLVLPASATGGVAQVTDRYGNVHNVACRINDGSLPEGREIIVFDYDQENDVYAVAAYPDAENARKLTNG
jgi:membrane protein implicated in regulation of membrane protease activity